MLHFCFCFSPEDLHSVSQRPVRHEQNTGSRQSKQHKSRPNATAEQNMKPPDQYPADDSTILRQTVCRQFPARQRFPVMNPSESQHIQCPPETAFFSQRKSSAPVNVPGPHINQKYTGKHCQTPEQKMQGILHPASQDSQILSCQADTEKNTEQKKENSRNFILMRG